MIKQKHTDIKRIFIEAKTAEITEKRINIHSDAKYPANELSNFYPHKFKIDGISCASMEGFLQSLKCPDTKQQLHICTLSGKEAKIIGQNYSDWKTEQILYWQDQEINRGSSAYQDLLIRAYLKLYKNKRFKDALTASRNLTLTHSIGNNDIKETVLIEKEFCQQLSNLRTL